MEFKEQIQRILENVPKVYDVGRSSIKNEVSNALKGSASGEAVALKDVSPLEHNLGVRVESKNLIPYPYYDTSKTENGVTFTDNGDGSITIDGTSTATVNYMFTNINKLFLPAGTYSMSNGNPEAKGYMLIGLQNSEWTDQKTGNISFDKTIYGTLGYCIYQIPKGNTFDNVTIYPQLEYGTKATPWRPYVANPEAVKLLVQGANLISYPYENTTKTVNGITFTDNGDGSITANGTATADAYFILSYHKYYGDKNANAISNVATNGQYVFSKGLFYGGDNAYLPLSITIPSGATVNNEVFYPQVEIGKTVADATAYEPYKEPIEYAQGEEIKSIYPSTTLMTDTEGAVVEVEYNRDLNKAFAELYQAIISLGGNV